jgi:uncharacterized protein (TIGR01777 family)
MRIIITGGTGSIGVPTANTLHRAGHEVIVLTRSLAKVQQLQAHGTLDQGIQGVLWDTRTAAGWGHLLDTESAIVNLAGENLGKQRWSEVFQQVVLQSRLDALSAVHQVIEQAAIPPQVLIQASAVGYYGSRGSAILTEAAPPRSDLRGTMTDRWEAAAAGIPIRCCILRIGIVLDKNSGALPAFVMGSRFGLRQLGDGQQYIPWIHRQDVANSIAFLIQEPSASGVYNVSAPQPATNRQLVRTLAQVSGRLALFPIPALLLQTVMGPMARAVLDSQRVVPQRLLEAGFRFQYGDLAAALRDTLG